MKTILPAVVLLVTALTTFSRPETRPPTPPADTNMIVWCGLDYTMAKDDFHDPTAVLPQMMRNWNFLFVNETLQKISSKIPPVKVETEFIYNRNETALLDEVTETGDAAVKSSSITDADIAKTVQSYQLKNNQGIGIVFIVDRLVKGEGRSFGCLYAVFFDVPSRKILYSERIIGETGGAGFRNFWMKPIKIAGEKIPSMYKKLKK